MPKNSDEQLYDADSPRFTRDMMRRAMPFSKLSPAMQQALAPDTPELDQTQELVSIPLSKDVAEALRATGAGWQGRLDEHLRDWLHAAPAELERAS